MAAAKEFLAFDLGAESGRAILGSVSERGMELEEIHRFANGAVRAGERLYWDHLRLLSEVQRGATLTAHQVGEKLSGIGVSTWGIDFALLDEAGEPIGLPYCYRDTQTDGAMEAVFEIVPRDEVYRQTGIQIMSINSLYQLFAISRRVPERLERAKSLLFTPDLFNFWFSGEQRSELTISSTSQLFRGGDRTWATDMLKKLELPHAIFAELVEPGSIIGELLPDIANSTGAGAVPVIAVAGHDTAGATAAVPFVESAAIISCGTWSSIGYEVSSQCTSDLALESNFTNEVGVDNTFMFRKNMTGLWLMEECRRDYTNNGKEYSYEKIVEMAAGEPGFGSIVEPDFPEFLSPGDMLNKIAGLCRTTGQRVPESPAATFRLIIESMALKYRFLLDLMDRVLGITTDTVHLVGGGSRNELLCQFTANATGRRVVAGPAEATAMGNIMMQAIATGVIANVAQGRELIRKTTSPVDFVPSDHDRWEEFYQRFLTTLKDVPTAF